MLGREAQTVRKILFLAACLMLLFITPALAQTYSFSDVCLSLDVPADYDVVLTNYNLSANSEWIAAQGLDYDALSNEFEAEGILLKAFDAKNSRTLVLSAQDDLDAQTYFDLNKQDEDMRREYRLSHTNGTAYGILGYSYSSAKWANYGANALRFLQTQYSLRQEGQQVCTGYQRRTIRNGYTITLDMQVTGRAAKEADNTALEKVMKTVSFTQILPTPELPVKLSVSSAPPTETNEDTFTIKGTSARNAEITVATLSLGATGGKTYTTKASSSGAFSVKITLPSQGVYSVTLTAQAAGAITAQRLYSVTYQKGILPVDLTLTPAETLGDTTQISGSTINGAKTQLSVSGPISYNKTATSKSFNFKVDTSAEGTYHFVISVTKKGLEERVFTYTATREYNDYERVDKIRASAKKITYANLSKASNEGKIAVLTGYVTSVETSINEWVVTVSLTKNKDNYKDVVYMICDTEPGYGLYTKVKVYGRVAGTYSVLGEDGKIKYYPRLECYWFEAAE